MNYASISSNNYPKKMEHEWVHTFKIGISKFGEDTVEISQIIIYIILFSEPIRTYNIYLHKVKELNKVVF